MSGITACRVQLSWLRQALCSSLLSDSMPPAGCLQVVHTMTGHGDAVSCVACSPLQESTAVSTGEDRCIKVGAALERGAGTQTCSSSSRLSVCVQSPNMMFDCCRAPCEAPFVCHVHVFVSGLPQVWDLAKGFSSRSLLYPKMPTALTLSLDGQTIITGECLTLTH